jgi:hypothetical protein
MYIEIGSFKKDVDKAIKSLDDLAGLRLPAAVNKALNQTAKQAKKAALQAAGKTYTLPSGRLSKAVGLRLARRGSPVAIISATGRAPGLQHYKAKEIRTAGGSLASFGVSKQGGLYGRRIRRGRRGVTVEVFKGMRKPVKGGFLATMPSGGVGVFRRVGKGRLPIRRLYGPSVPGMFRARLKDTVAAVARKRFVRNLQREIRNELYKAGRLRT